MDIKVFEGMIRDLLKLVIRQAAKSTDVEVEIPSGGILSKSSVYEQGSQYGC